MESSKGPFDFDNEGWKIDERKLVTPERGEPYHYVYDKLFVSSDEKYACLFYTINEYRMGAQAGLIGVFANKNNAILIANPENQWFDYQGKDSVWFFNNKMFVRKLAYHNDENLSGTPFVIFYLDEKKFGFVDFDWSSIYYSPIKISDTVFKFHLDSPNELKNLTPNRNGEEFDISTIKYHSFEKLNNIMAIYFHEKSL
ncbi:hypothetical protein [Mucilaginibacter sp.]|uniref:hypothetical protein n=1 Tax=Mucilaginibacter sp. TaxID=1882438 RepID=UPI002ED38D9A